MASPFVVERRGRIFANCKLMAQQYLAHAFRTPARACGLSQYGDGVSEHARPARPLRQSRHQIPAHRCIKTSIDASLAPACRQLPLNGRPAASTGRSLLPIGGIFGPLAAASQRGQPSPPMPWSTLASRRQFHHWPCVHGLPHHQPSLPAG